MVPFIAFRPGYRLYWDDWVIARSPELRTFVSLGPVELRVTGRFYTQRAAIFIRVKQTPDLPDGQGLPCSDCRLAASREGRFYLSNPKLTAFNTVFLEARVLLRLDALRRLRRLPLAGWLAAGDRRALLGHYFNNRYAHTSFGDSHVAGLTLSFISVVTAASRAFSAITPRWFRPSGPRHRDRARFGALHAMPPGRDGRFPAVRPQTNRPRRVVAGRTLRVRAARRHR